MKHWNPPPSGDLEVASPPPPPQKNLPSRWTPSESVDRTPVYSSLKVSQPGPHRKQCALFHRCPECRTRVRIRNGRQVEHDRVLRYAGNEASWTCGGSGALVVPLIELVALVGPELAGVDVSQLERVQCPACRTSVALYDGRREAHRDPANLRTPWQQCKGAWRLHTGRANNMQGLAVLAAGLWFMGSLDSHASVKRQRFATLRACVPRWGPLKPSNAKLTMEEAGAVMAASWPRVKLEAKVWLWDNQVAVETLPRSQAVLSAGLNVPIALTGGMNEVKRDARGNEVVDRQLPGNDIGRYLDALPFRRRKRREAYPSVHNLFGDKSGTYSGDYGTKLTAQARLAGKSVRQINKIAKPITSYAEGQHGPYDSTWTTYPNRYVESDTYVTREQLREVFDIWALREWVAAVKLELREKRWAYLWAKTEQVRKFRRWVTYEEQIQEPVQRAEKIRARQIARKYKSNAVRGIGNRHQDTNESKIRNNSGGHAAPSGPLAPVPPDNEGSYADTGPPPPQSEDRKDAGQEGGARSVPPTPAAALPHECFSAGWRACLICGRNCDE